jgi:hypothetical protein
MKLSLSLLALVLAPLAFGAADSPLPDFLSPDTRVAFGIDVRHVVDSKVGQSVTADAHSMGKDWLKLVPLVGFDPLHDVDEVLVASPGGAQNAPVLIVAWGRFNLESFAKGAKKYKGVPVIEGPAGSASSLALLDENTALIADLPELHAAIDRRGKGATIDSSLAERIGGLRGHFDIWGVGDRPEGFVPAPAEGDTKGFESVDRFHFGLMVSHGLEFVGEVHARESKDVEKLVTAVQFLETMVKMQQQSAGASPTPKLEVHAEEGTLRLSFALSEEDLQKAIDSQRAALKAVAGQAPQVSGQDAPPDLKTVEAKAPEAPAEERMPEIKAPEMQAPEVKPPAETKAPEAQAEPAQTPDVKASDAPVPAPEVQAPTPAPAQEAAPAPTPAPVLAANMAAKPAAAPAILNTPAPLLAEMPVSPAPPQATPKPAPRNGGTQILSKDGDTLVLTLPGKR